MSATNSPARNRVLVIDDDPGVREMFQRSLELARFDVVVASGGVEGLRMLRADATSGLVLLDLMMPTVTRADLLNVVAKYCHPLTD